jgi:hypothetical protein
MRRPEQCPSDRAARQRSGRLSCPRGLRRSARPAWRETDVEHTDLEILIEHLLEGHYSNPVRIVAFNTAEGWSRDVSEEVARILSQRCAEQRRDLVFSVQEFVDRCQNPGLVKR